MQCSGGTQDLTLGRVPPVTSSVAWGKLVRHPTLPLLLPRTRQGWSAVWRGSPQLLLPALCVDLENLWRLTEPGDLNLPSLDTSGAVASGSQCINHFLRTRKLGSSQCSLSFVREAASWCPGKQPGLGTAS